MSDWKETDEITTTVGSIWLSQKQAHAAGVKSERERILKLLFETQISVPKEGLTERDSEAMQHALFQFTLKLRGLIKEGNNVE